jgi:hypothetical protein
MANPYFLYDNRLADAAITASTTASDYAADNVSDWRPYTWWKPTALPATLTVDCGSARAADYALIYGHDLFSRGCTVEVRGSTDNFAASDVLVATLTPTDDDPILATFNSASYRYWRLKIAGSAAPVLAIAAVGARLTAPTGLPQGFDPVGRMVEGQANRNDNGQPLGKVVEYEMWKQSISLQRVTWSWLRDTWLPAWRAHLRSTPFVFAWDATAYARDLKLVSAGQSFASPHQAGSYCDLRVELTGVVT